MNITFMNTFTGKIFIVFFIYIFLGRFHSELSSSWDKATFLVAMIY